MVKRPKLYNSVAFPSSEMKVHYIAGVGYDSNVYLLQGDDPIVVDTGTGMFADTMLEELSKLVPLRKVGRIVLTHCHYDHMGGAAKVQKATGGRIYLHEAEAGPIMAGDNTLAVSPNSSRVLIHTPQPQPFATTLTRIQYPSVHGLPSAS